MTGEESRFRQTPSPTSGAHLPQTPGFRSFLDLRDNVTPCFREPLPVIVLDRPKRRVMELDQSSAGFFAEPVLYGRYNWIRHHQRSIDLNQRGPLDRLH